MSELIIQMKYTVKIKECQIYFFLRRDAVQFHSSLPTFQRNLPAEYLHRYHQNGDLDSSVGIATRYGLDCSRIKSRWEARFSAPVQTGPWGPTHNGYRVFPEGKAAGAWC
jgi:hypothetical protein